MPVRLQRKRTKGYRLPPNAVYVGRPTPWGNPFIIGLSRRRDDGVEERVSNAATAVHFFRAMLARPDRHYPSDNEVREALAGKDLVCWCPLDQPCHADVLLAIANAPDTESAA